MMPRSSGPILRQNGPIRMAGCLVVLAGACQSGGTRADSDLDAAAVIDAPTSRADQSPDEGAESDSLATARSCRDGMQNAGEEAADCGGPCRPCSESEADVYVDPLHGDDEASGSRTAPLRTVKAARDRARSLRAAARERKTPLVVLLRDGTYYLEQAVVLEPADSGSTDSPLVFRAYPGEQPILSGGVAIQGWKTTAEGAWQVTLPDAQEGWAPNQLWIDGQRRYRPQLPKKGFYWIHFKVPPVGSSEHDSRFGYAGRDLDPSWHRLGEVELLIWHHWTISRMRIESIDTANRVVTLTGEGRCSRPFCQFRPGYRFLVENAREALSEPGQWYLDQGSGLLTYLPSPSEEPEDATVVMPRLRQLLRIEGEPDQPVKHVTFEGLAFVHTHFATPAAGYPSRQAESMLEAAIELSKAENIAFKECRVEHTAEYGIALRDRCHRNLIEGCVLRDLGAGAIRIGTSAATADASAVTSHNIVRDNLLVTGGRVHPAGVGVLIQHAAHNLVAHNEIADFYYSGISVGWNWGYGLSNAHHNEVAYNRVHMIGQHVLSDMGGVYTLGVSPGTRVHHNVFSKIRRVRYGGWGIYPDQASSDILFDHNLVYDTQDAPFHLHFGEDLALEHNVLVDDYGAGLLRRSKTEEGRFSVNARHNVLVTTGNAALTREWTDGQYAFDYNLYHRAPLDYAGRDFGSWQAEGHDQHSAEADPAFENPIARDYTFGLDSPAAQLGIDSPALQGAGRLRAPRSADLHPAPRAFREALGVAPVVADFEHMTAGKAPTIGTANDGGSDSSLVVTDSTAAAATAKSLLFQDGPDLDFAYNPHYVLRTQHASGHVRLQFWLRWEQEAKVLIEWRDWSTPDFVTGPILSIDAAGELTAEDQSLATLPAGQWVHFDMQAAVGDQAGDRYTLRLTRPGNAITLFDDLRARHALQRLTWIGFISTATTRTRFYLDEVVGERL